MCKVETISFLFIPELRIVGNTVTTLATVMPDNAREGVVR